MRRRQLLASGAALLSVAGAGCGHPSVVLDMDEATAADIADEVSVRADPGSEERTVVTAAVENGSATRSGQYALFDRTDTVRVDDSFHAVSETRLESREVTVHVVLVDFDPDDSTPEIGEITYEDLPEVDRQRLTPITSEEPPDQDGPEIGIQCGTTADLGTESVLVPDQHYDIVVHDGTRYRIETESRTTSEAEYRYEVSEVASSVDAFAAQVRARYLFALAGLSDAEREVVAAATDGGYFQDDDAFQSVVDRIRDHEGLNVDEFYGTWRIQYDGIEYLTYVEW
jgi:hypothetical protein